MITEFERVILPLHETTNENASIPVKCFSGIKGDLWEKDIRMLVAIRAKFEHILIYLFMSTLL